METVTNGKIKKFPDFTGEDTLTELLASIVGDYDTKVLHGNDMLIVFTGAEEKLIRDSARPLLGNHLSSMNDTHSDPERLLLYKALEAAISALLLGSAETMIPVSYIRVIEGKADSRRLGIVYHNFSSDIRVIEHGLAIHLYDPGLVMRVK